MNVVSKQRAVRLFLLMTVSHSYVAIAQVAATAAPVFEVSTVRPSSPNQSGSNLNLGFNEIRSTNLPVLFLIKFAFNLNAGSNDQIIELPRWAVSELFNITAKTDAETGARIQAMAPDERIAATRKMVEALLSDRFQLKVHHETRELPVLALVVAKGGSKLTQTTDEHPVEPRDTPSWSGLHNPRVGETEGRNVPVALLVNALSNKTEVGGRLVVDETGLIGKYNFKLTWTSVDHQATLDATDSGGPSLFSALQEQLGLKLESKRSQVGCIVIDHIEHPTPN